MFARRQSNRLSSTLEQRLRTSSALMLHFFLSAVYIKRKLGENDDVFFARDRVFSIRKTLISDHFDKLAFSLNKKLTDNVIFSHADILTGFRLDANNTIKFRAYRCLSCCHPPSMSRETWVGMSMAFSSSTKIFLSYVPGMHVVVFTRSSSVARAWSTPICCSTYCSTLKGPSQAPTREP